MRFLTDSYFALHSSEKILTTVYGCLKFCEKDMNRRRKNDSKNGKAASHTGVNVALANTLFFPDMHMQLHQRLGIG